MIDASRRVKPLVGVWLLLSMILIPLRLAGKNNQVMGEVQFEAISKIAKTSGVWVDGQYVGYLRELKGSKSIMLLPGEHEITVRQDGYQDFTGQVQIQPGKIEVVRVAMQKAPEGRLPLVLATVKIDVNPSRAAVFVDGQYVGHVGEFEGLGHGLLVAPGVHKIKIALPGYETFITEIQPSPRQKVEIKTDLPKSNGPLSGPLIEKAASDATPQAGTPTASTQPR
jgi:hypothetical protein